ncbi:MAG TPA: ArsA family ATPase [Acidimicrobiales bacterium]|nr:ArsA family ATPase [Acidimicrobiales bacterium]
MAASRLIVVTGKGGVGKTTTAAATALASAGRKHRTLVVSTDPAHSLADVLGRAVGDEPTAVAPNLHAIQIDTRRRMEQQWGELRGYASAVLAWAGVGHLAAEELTLLPGIEEVLALTALTDLADDPATDVLVVDCAPTAETLRLLSLPDVLGWWMERLFPLGRQVTRIVRRVVAGLSDVPVAGDAQFAALERLHTRLAAVRDLLGDRTRTSVRLVVQPEAVVVAEARRTATYLSLFGFALDAVVVNRVLPPSVQDPFFAAWQRSQAQQLRAVEDGFAPVPVLVAPFAPEEPVGATRLRAFAKALYGRRDPTGHLHDASHMDARRDGDGWELGIELPFAASDDVTLVRRADEVVVTVGAYRRAIMLPDSLADRKVERAAVRDGRLVIHFRGDG